MIESNSPRFITDHNREGPHRIFFMEIEEQMARFEVIEGPYRLRMAVGRSAEFPIPLFEHLNEFTNGVG